MDQLSDNNSCEEENMPLCTEPRISDDTMAGDWCVVTMKPPKRKSGKEPETKAPQPQDHPVDEESGEQSSHDCSFSTNSESSFGHTAYAQELIDEDSFVVIGTLPDLDILNTDVVPADLNNKHKTNEEIASEEQAPTCPTPGMMASNKWIPMAADMYKEPLESSHVKATSRKERRQQKNKSIIKARTGVPTEFMKPLERNKEDKVIQACPLSQKKKSSNRIVERKSDKRDMGEYSPPYDFRCGIAECWQNRANEYMNGDRLYAGTMSRDLSNYTFNEQPAGRYMRPICNVDDKLEMSFKADLEEVVSADSDIMPRKQFRHKLLDDVVIESKNNKNFYREWKSPLEKLSVSHSPASVELTMLSNSITTYDLGKKHSRPLEAVGHVKKCFKLGTDDDESSAYSEAELEGHIDQTKCETILASANKKVGRKAKKTLQTELVEDDSSASGGTELKTNVKQKRQGGHTVIHGEVTKTKCIKHPTRDSKASLNSESVYSQASSNPPTAESELFLEPKKQARCKATSDVKRKHTPTLQPSRSFAESYYAACRFDDWALSECLRKHQEYISQSEKVNENHRHVRKNGSRRSKKGTADKSLHFYEAPSEDSSHLSELETPTPLLKR